MMDDLTGVRDLQRVTIRPTDKIIVALDDSAAMVSRDERDRLREHVADFLEVDTSRVLLVWGMHISAAEAAA